MPQIETKELGQKFYPFQLPIRKEWETGSVLPAWHVSEVMLGMDILPDLLFRAVLKLNPDLNAGENQWQLYLEADKKHLLDLGLIRPYTVRPAVFGATELDARHVLSLDGYSALKRLRVQVYQPEEGVFESETDVTDLRLEGEAVFWKFYPIDRPYSGGVYITEDPNNQERLDQIWAQFLLTDDEILEAEIELLQKRQRIADELARIRHI